MLKMNKWDKTKIALWIVVGIWGLWVFCLGAATNTPWDGTEWDSDSPDIDQPLGNAYKELYSIRRGVEIRSNKEHVTLASSSAGGEHKQGSARAFFQDAAPTTQIDGSAWIAGDTGSLWFDTNSSPDNLVYVLTNHASTGTWTLLSVSMTAEIVAAAHQWADVQTFDVQTVHTLGLLANGPITLGAGDDLIGSATSDITINTNKFTVDGATGNTLVAGTLDVTGVLTTTAAAVLGDGSTLAAATVSGDGDRTISDKAYVDSGAASVIKAWVDLTAAGTKQQSFNVSATAKNTTGKYTVTWDTDFAGTDYVVVAMTDGSNATRSVIWQNKLTTSCDFWVYEGSDPPVLTDGRVNVIAIGAQ